MRLNDFSFGKVNLDLFNGQVSVKRTIDEVGGLKFGYNLSIVVSNNLSNPFKLNIEKKITVDSSDSNIYYYEDENGLIHKYTYSNGYCTSTSNIKRGLRKLSHGYEIIYPDFTKEIYNSNGQITSIQNNLDETICTYAYNTNNKLASFTCGSHTITFNYDSSNRLISAVKSNETLFQVTYNTNNTLITIGNVKYEITGSTNTFTIRTLTSSNVEKEKIVKTVGTNNIRLQQYIEGSLEANTLIKGPFTDSNTKQIRTVEDSILNKKTAYVYESYLLSQSYEILDEDMFSQDPETYLAYYNADVKIFDETGKQNGLLKPEDVRYTKISRGYIYSVDTSNVITFKKNSDSSIEKVPLPQTVYISFWVNKSSCPVSSFSVKVNNTANSSIKTISLTDLHNGLNFVCCPVTLKDNSDDQLLDTLYIIPNQFTGSGSINNYFLDIRMTFTGPTLNYHANEILYLDNNGDVSHFKVNYNGKSIEFQNIDEIKEFMLSVIKQGTSNKYVFSNNYTELHNISNFTWDFFTTENNIAELFNIKLTDKKISGTEEYYRDITKQVENNETYLKEEIKYYNTNGYSEPIVLSRSIIDQNYNIISEYSEGITKDYQYNTQNLLISDIVSSGTLQSKNTYEYNDIFNQLTKEVTNETEEVSYGYNDKGNVINQTYQNGTYTLPETFTYSNDLLVQYKKNNDKHLDYAYTNNNLSTVTEANLNYNFEYNKNKLSLVKENTYNVAGFEYQNNNLDLVTKVYTAVDAYYAFKDKTDKYGNLIKRTKFTSSDPTEITVFENEYTTEGILFDTYNSASLVKVKDFIDKEYRYTYDTNRNITQISEYQNNSLKYSVNYKYGNKNEGTALLSNIVLKEKEFTYLLIPHKETYEYDSSHLNNKKLTKVSSYEMDIEMSNLSYDYDSLNRVTRKSLFFPYLGFSPKSYSKNYYYKTITKNDVTYQTNLVSSIWTNINNSSSLSVPKITYISYDEKNNISEIKEGSILTELKVSYVYDDYNRLVRENNAELNLTYTYEYDDNGNILNKKQYAYTTGELGTVQNQYNYTYSSDRLNQLTNYNGTNTGIDYEGNITKINGYNAEYSYGKLSRVYKNSTLGGRESYSYTYDNSGLRTKKYYSFIPGQAILQEYITTKTHTYTYILDKLFKEEINTIDQDLVGKTETIEYKYINDELVGFTYTDENGNINDYVYERNILNDVEIIYDNSTGNIVAKYAYDAYGNCTIKTNVDNIANINPIRYRGYYYDSETQLYWVSSRYYSPELCRWISPDSVDYLDPSSINGLNLYAYCGNDPVNKYDPSGHAFISVLVGLGIAALIGAGIGAASYTAGQLIDYAITGDFEWSWGGFIGSTVGGAIGGAITFATAGIGGAFATMAGAFLSGAAITSSTMVGENIAGDASHSFEDILISSLISGGISMASVGIMSKIKIPGLNAGKGSMSTVSKQMYTKFQRQIIKRVSMRTFGKMLAVEAYNGSVGNVMEWVYSISGARDYVLNFF